MTATNTKPRVKKDSASIMMEIERITTDLSRLPKLVGELKLLTEKEAFEKFNTNVMKAFKSGRKIGGKVQTPADSNNTNVADLEAPKPTANIIPSNQPILKPEHLPQFRMNWVKQLLKNCLNP